MLSRTLRTEATSKVKRAFFATASSETLVKTALNDLHKDLGGDMVPFAGYELPVLYKGENGGVMKEHLWCRAEGKASMFDVSHMGQVRTDRLQQHRLISRAVCSRPVRHEAKNHSP